MRTRAPGVSKVGRSGNGVSEKGERLGKKRRSFACFETPSTQARYIIYNLQRIIIWNLLVISFVVIVIVCFVNSAFPGNSSDACYQTMDGHCSVFIWLVHKYFVYMGLKGRWFRTLHVERPVAFSRLVVVFQAFWTVLLQRFSLGACVES